MRLYLIRHAVTQIDPTLDAKAWALSALGEQQAAELASAPFWREVSRIVVSSERKTRLTVEPTLARYHLPVHVDARVDELHRPGFVEDYYAQVRQAFAVPMCKAGEWESAHTALARVQAAIGDLLAQYPDETVALVGHGLTLSLYRADLLGQAQVDFAAWRTLGFATVAIVNPASKQLLRDFAAIGI